MVHLKRNVTKCWKDKYNVDNYTTKRLHIDESILSLTYGDTYLHITTGDKILSINIEKTYNGTVTFKPYVEYIILCLGIIKDKL